MVPDFAKYKRIRECGAKLAANAGRCGFDSHPVKSTAVLVSDRQENVMSDGYKDGFVNLPDSGGVWLWQEYEYCQPVELTLTDDGKEVASVDSEQEGVFLSPQEYWEQTPVEKMGGRWKKKTE